MKYRVTIITTHEETIDADNIYDCDNKAQSIKNGVEYQLAGLGLDEYKVKAEYRPLDQEEIAEYNRRTSSLHPTFEKIFDSITRPVNYDRSVHKSENVEQL